MKSCCSCVRDGLDPARCVTDAVLREDIYIMYTDFFITKNDMRQMMACAGAGNQSVLLKHPGYNF
jgi:hypothetical protein